MKGDCYNELIEVFYYNVKEIDGNIHSRVKGVDIVIDDDVWWKFTGMKNEGELSHKFDCPRYKKIRKTEMFKSFMRYRGRYRKEKGFLFKWLDKEEKVIAFIIGHILLPGRYNIIKLTPRDVCLLY
ncbi:hypothetical protein V8G54_028799 [Vigna mungo]|uniref:Uncharacterized protein n=1 Tax=Vigna mungo TaxID=3915 RepID=A0AAQ3RII7_VIGMU